jgi:hypothetical protein
MHEIWREEGMMLILQAQRASAHVLRYVWPRFARIHLDFGRLSRRRATPAPIKPPADAARVAAYDSSVLRHAVYHNSPEEIDWLLHAAILTDTAKRRYCLERALQINPTSDVARHALDRLLATEANRRAQ